MLAEPAGAGVTVRAATGAWSGVMAMPNGPMPTVIGVPGVLVATSIGVTLPDWMVLVT